MAYPEFVEDLLDWKEFDILSSAMIAINIIMLISFVLYWELTCQKYIRTGQKKLPSLYMTLHRLAPPLCPIFFYVKKKILKCNFFTWDM